DPINYADPSGKFLTALTLFLDQMNFPNAMAHFDELYLFFGDFSYIEGSTDNFAGGYLLVGPTPAEKSREQAKTRITGKCLEFILKALKKAFDAQNDQSASDGYPPNASVLGAQNEATSRTSFINTMMNADLVSSGQPDKDIPNASASAQNHTITLYPLFNQ